MPALRAVSEKQGEHIPLRDRMRVKRGQNPIEVNAPSDVSRAQADPMRNRPVLPQGGH